MAELRAESERVFLAMSSLENSRQYVRYHLQEAGMEELASRVRHYQANRQ